MTTATQKTICVGEGSKLVSNGRTRTRIPCATCAQYHAPLPAQRRLDATMQALAAATTDGQVREIERELAQPGHERLFAILNPATGIVATFSAPTSPDTGATPGATLSPARRHELEQQRDLALRLVDDKQSSPEQRRRAQQDADKLSKILDALPTTAGA